MEGLELFFVLVEQMNICKDMGIDQLVCFQDVIEQLQQLNTEPEKMI